MLLTLLLLPLAGSAISGLLGRLIGYNSSKYIATFCIFIALLISINLYYNVMINNHIYSINLGVWFNVDNINIDWAFIIDELSVSLLIPICLVSTLVHLYATSYMAHDPYQQRFFSILSLFTGFMIILVTGSNYLILFIGWELIGVASYLLISHWYTVINAIKSGLSSLLVNKFGDALLTIGLLLMLVTFGSLNYSTVFSLSNYINSDIITLIMLCLLIGAMAKSAQIGLHIWLLYSMAGPTPVSALLHAACLVCAGIYLLLRSSYLLEFTPIILLLILWIGGLTTLIAGLIAIVSNDLKKIIALSTMSQLGLMIVAIGLSNYNASIYHLFTHAMFKALLFMSAGSIIHSIVTESQDIRTFGGLTNFTPITYTCLLIGSLSLMAIPGLSGFYSKDIIIESSYGVYSLSGYIVYWFALISATLTTIYSFRLIYLVFYNTPNANKYSYYIVQEWDIFLILPMIILAIFSIFVGYLTRDLYLGMGSPFTSLFTHPDNLSIIETEFNLPIYIKLLPLILSLFFISSILLVYEFNYKLLPNFTNGLFYNYYLCTNTKFMLDNIFNNDILRSVLNFSYYLNLYIDRGLLYIYGPVGLYRSLNILSYNITSTSSNIHLINNNNKFKSSIKHYNFYLFFLLITIATFLLASLFISLSQLTILFFIFLISLPILL